VFRHELRLSVAADLVRRAMGRSHSWRGVY
jgi:hypothetical protein